MNPIASGRFVLWANIALYLLMALVAYSGEVFGQTTDLWGSPTHYVRVMMPGAGPVDMLVDTGAAKVVLPPEAEKAVKGLKFLRDETAILANGMEVPYKVYKLEKFTVGGCEIKDIEVALMPGARPIIGMSALARLTPITLDLAQKKINLTCQEG